MQTSNKKVEKRISTNVIAAISSLFIIIGGFFLFNNYITKKKIYAYDYVANMFYKIEEKTKLEKTVEKEEKEEEEYKIEVSPEGYIGYLEIPKINLSKGFVDKNSPDNDVDKNIYIAPASDYPDVENGNFIIAGHSGTGWRAFFNDLYKLEKGDQINIAYKNRDYTYIIDDIYKQEKTGTISIYRNQKKNTVTLVTCTNDDPNTQTVYIAYLD